MAARRHADEGADGRAYRRADAGSVGLAGGTGAGAGGAATLDAQGWFGRALLLVLAITGLRVVLLAFDRTDLFVDEAQYWLWGQHLDFGYYSKPPMVAWAIRAATELGGDGRFWVRLPAPLCNAATALLLGAAAAPLAGARAAVWVTAAWLTLPMVALGSLLISTDIVMFPFLAAALIAYLASLRGAGLAVACLGGIALGLGFLSKYAALYLVFGALLALPLRPRLGFRQALGFLAGFLLAAAPNLIWNLANGAPTLAHTLDNADWVRDPGARAGLHPGAWAGFVAAQFIVFGPVLFGALLWLAATWRRRDGATRRLLLLSLPVVALVSLQALVSHAYANWAAAAYLAGTLATLPWLLARPRWLAASFVVNGALCLALPLATVIAPAPIWHGQPLLARYLGRAEMSRAIVAAAREAGLETVVAGNRDILADLFYTGRDSGLSFRSVPPKGRAANHYQMRYPFAGGAAPVLYVAEADRAVCAGAERLGVIAPAQGVWHGHPMALWRLPGICLNPG
jgi:4-amino-4-deoxy-L-arabinose transferase-like glycosyltransferase